MWFNEFFQSNFHHFRFRWLDELHNQNWSNRWKCLKPDRNRFTSVCLIWFHGFLRIFNIQMMSNCCNSYNLAIFCDSAQFWGRLASTTVDWWVSSLEIQWNSNSLTVLLSRGLLGIILISILWIGIMLSRQKSSIIFRYVSKLKLQNNVHSESCSPKVIFQFKYRILAQFTSNY